jgi:serine/threonine protein kinase
VELRDPFDLAGVTIDGKYRIASVVGEGGFGVVYRGVHKGFGELIAVKCLRVPRDLDETERNALLSQLQEEGRILHRLSKATSGIVQALDVGAFVSPRGAWIPYLVLEWLEGETLGDFVKRRAETGAARLGLTEAVRLLAPVARALAVAHGQKIAHRDVKPANVFLTAVGGRSTSKVLDFGIAKVLAAHGAYDTTATVPTAFTPRYGAPEQFSKERGATGPWTDVFALALMLVECASGKRALLGDDPTQLYIAAADTSRRPTLRARGLEVSDAVEAVVVQALEVDPKRRYPDAGAFWHALETAVETTTPDPAPHRGSVDDPVRASSPPVSAGGLGPTMPHERLGSDSGRPLGRAKSHDTMAETPLPERRGGSKATASSPPPSTRSRGGSGALIFALTIFAGGAAFAWYTLDQASSGSASGEPVDSSRPRAPQRASLVPSSATASASAAPSASMSAAPSASASAAPSALALDVGPPPPGMALVEAATFAFGSLGRVIPIDRPFWIDQREVTVGRYAECIAASACTEARTLQGFDEHRVALWGAKCNAERGDRALPQNCVTAEQADRFCAWRGARLPTDAEWELAARGPSGRRYVWGGGDLSCEHAHYDRGGACGLTDVEPQSTRVGQIEGDRTPEFVFDLAGNVAEWTASGGDQRVIRGAHFADDKAWLLATKRRRASGAIAHPTLGFRCAATVALPDAPPPPAGPVASDPGPGDPIPSFVESLVDPEPH